MSKPLEDELCGNRMESQAKLKQTRFTEAEVFALPLLNVGNTSVLRKEYGTSVKYEPCENRCSVNDPTRLD